VAPADFTSRSTRARSSVPHERHRVLVEFRFERCSSTKSAFCPVTGRAFGIAEARLCMVNVPALLAVALTVFACTTGALADPAIAGVGDVRVLAVRLVPTGETGPGLAGANATYVVATVALTNGSTHDMTPAIERFIYTSARNERYAGTDSGSAAFVGVSNSHQMLKHGEKRDYTVGFRTTDAVAAGTISYEP
jgi:hypothetical protein